LAEVAASWPLGFLAKIANLAILALVSLCFDFRWQCHQRQKQRACKKNFDHDGPNKEKAPSLV